MTFRLLWKRSVLTGIVHPKWKFAEPVLTQAIQDIDEFVSFYEQIWEM